MTKFEFPASEHPWVLDRPRAMCNHDSWRRYCRAADSKLLPFFIYVTTSESFLYPSNYGVMLFHVAQSSDETIDVALVKGKHDL